MEYPTFSLQDSNAIAVYILSSNVISIPVTNALSKPVPIIRFV